MSAGGDGFAAVAGGPAHHIPVLGQQAVQFLNVRDGGIYVDATFGAGGYTRAILAAANCKVIGLDRDPLALTLGAELARAAQGRLILQTACFSALDEVARAHGFAAVDGVVFDLGVSSMQLDTAARGFSFRRQGPLDMRMGGEGPSAADLVAQADERDLAAIIFTLGEERRSRAIARAIVKARAKAPVNDTMALAEVVSAAVPSRPGDIHPATRTFQALRIFINDELGELASGLAAAERILKPGGRMVVVAFHSLEDRLVKTFLAARGEARGTSRHAPERRSLAPTFRALTRRLVVAAADEIARNPRARSAKLRAAERSEAPARDDAVAAPLQLPSLADVLKGR